MMMMAIVCAPDVSLSSKIKEIMGKMAEKGKL